MQEVGETGLYGARPQEGWLYQEFLPQLRGLEGAKKYREMSDNDPVINGVLYAIEMIIRNVKWRIDEVGWEEAGLDEATALEAQALVEGMLFKDMAQPFEEYITEALSMLTYGYALLEIVYKRRNGETDDPKTSSIFSDGLIGVAKLARRHQQTVWRWKFHPEGDAYAVEQFRIGQPNAIIPLEKCLLFRTKSDANNPEGRSILRSAYIPYVRKQVLEEAEGRLAVRSAGVVEFRIPGKWLGPDATAEEAAMATAYKTIADNLAKDRSGSIVLPSDRDDKGNAYVEMKFNIAETRQATNLDTSINRLDRRIASAVLADFILLGQTDVGSFALADNKTNMFARACGAVVSSLAEVINRGLLPKLWKLNGLDPQYMPKLVAGDLETPDLGALAAYVQTLAGSGAALFPNPKLEEHLLSIANLPTAQEQG